MDNLHSPVERHYTRGNLLHTILSALSKAGKAPGSLLRNDLLGLDEFHIRGAQATRQMADAAALQPGMKVLDVGCGLGGPARLLADEFGCDVTGIDITKEYIEVAERLSAMTGLQNKTRFIHGNALDLPFANESYDVVWTQHVQLNIADKKKFYEEITRVLRQHGRLIYYDVFSLPESSVYLPLPWAEEPSMNHLITMNAYHRLLEQTGLTLIQRKDETADAILFFEKTLQRFETKDLPLVGLHLVIGDDALSKYANVSRNLCEGRIVVESGIAEKI